MPSLAQLAMHRLWYGEETMPQEPLYRTQEAVELLLRRRLPPRWRGKSPADMPSWVDTWVRKGLLHAHTYPTTPSALAEVRVLWPAPTRAPTRPRLPPGKRLSTAPPSERPAKRRKPRHAFTSPLLTPPHSSAKTTLLPSRELRERKALLERRLARAKDTLRARDILERHRSTSEGLSLPDLIHKWRTVAQDVAERLRSRLDPSLFASEDGRQTYTKVPLGLMLKHLGLIQELSLLRYNEEEDEFDL